MKHFRAFLDTMRIDVHNRMVRLTLSPNKQTHMLSFLQRMRWRLSFYGIYKPVEWGE